MFGLRASLNKKRRQATENSETASVASQETVEIRSTALDVHGSESASTSAVPIPRYETVSAADFERAMSLGTETAVIEGTKERVESAVKHPTGELNAPPRYETQATARKMLLESQELPDSKTALKSIDSSSTTLAEAPSLQRQLVLFQQEEALKSWDAKDYAATEPLILDMLRSELLTEDERVVWELRLVPWMQYQGRWRESLQVLEGIRQRSEDGNNHGLILRLTAEAKFQLKEFEVAREIGTKALEVLELTAARENDPRPVNFYICIEMMARIAEATGRQIEARFYRSKVVESYVDPGHLSQTARNLDTSKQSDKQSTQSPLDIPVDSTTIVAAYLEPYGVTLVDGGMSVRDDQFLMAFGAATKDGNVQVTEALLKDDAVVQRKDESGRTALYYAIVNGRAETVKELLDRGADVLEHYIGEPAAGNIAKDTTFLPLDLAIFHYKFHSSCLEIAKMLFEYGAKCDTGYKPQPLVVAVEAGYNTLVELLLSNGADITAHHLSRSINATMLHIAAQSPSADARTIKILCKAGVNISAEDESGRTALHIAVAIGNEKTADALCAFGANINACDKRGLTPLHNAAAVSIRAMVSKLYRHGAKVNSSDADGWTALHHAANSSWDGRDDVVKILCEYKANVNAQNQDGNTPLHICATEGYTETVRLLCHRKVKVNLTNKKGETPLDCARRNLRSEAGAMNRKPSIRILLDSGGKFKAEHPSRAQMQIMKYYFDKDLEN